MVQASVFRELYSEKRVVLEERRARVDNSPLGRYLEELNGISYGNNYRRPVIGYQADIQNFGRQEVMEFFKRHYVPSKLTISVVGDTNSEEVSYSYSFSNIIACFVIRLSDPFKGLSTHAYASNLPDCNSP